MAKKSVGISRSGLAAKSLGRQVDDTTYYC
jgi:hypothetical protein